MNIGAAFPSKYVRAADLPDGKFITVTIDRVETDNVAGNGEPEECKPILFFAGKEKGLVLNKTNANTIAGAYGQETDDWLGKPVLIYATETQYGGKMVPCVRVKIPKGDARPTARPAANGATTQSRPKYQPQPAVFAEDEAEPAAVAGRLPPPSEDDDIPF